ncbi:UV-B-induced protein-like, chloroplastic [Iris pallida]|uniref:UV-B-induced protein-like, chloroplastic n=1 Tax=Iris pallida TaxID=29817 RepID=A0AAX6HRQ7_IRIPA|nr:UV-B-induced protein-like, chloroplastic [Iris pallida]
MNVLTQPSTSRRIAEVKNKERQRALEEIIYCYIVQKFMERDIVMIPSLSTSSYPTGKVDSWPNQEQKLEAVHSPDALEMIQSHLSLVIGERFVGPIGSIVQISKLKLGKLYAASIMYGYFLKRVDEIPARKTHELAPQEHTRSATHRRHEAQSVLGHGVDGSDFA